ncbi:hypothetical protein SDRG_05785 [Saprolegnia diclina VS20]|uniref:Uncharacterized protein n=1 Tax=Saprolegnia diclina (strain VS20) TaxID=1156394 RepID=T0QQG8_SAPDV|nr:hypothetical protein SDRG_05785 [Saprolegnia diclina VS20]EQC36961.1 hypothetical protein SDRG_05785 [Saprolegnia diclina VS20]|eukprot:XP_008609742.1 hypothetical protein SDRG_05785 [Saprolegnia diclina VS20]
MATRPKARRLPAAMELSPRLAENGRRKASFFGVGGLKRRILTTEYVAHLRKSTRAYLQRTAANDAPIFCEVCKVAFASEQKRHSHVSFSTLHALNVKEATALEKKTTKLAALDDESELPVTPRLLYHSSKLLLKTNTMLECSLYAQAPAGKRTYQRYVLVCTNLDLQKALPPIYVNGDLVDAMMVDETTKCATEVNVLLQTTARSSVGDWFMKRLVYAADPPSVALQRHPSDMSPIPLVSGPPTVVGVDSGLVRSKKPRLVSANTFFRKRDQVQSESAGAAVERQTATAHAEKAQSALSAYYGYNTQSHHRPRALPELDGLGTITSALETMVVTPPP